MCVVETKKLMIHQLRPGEGVLMIGRGCGKSFSDTQIVSLYPPFKISLYIRLTGIGGDAMVIRSGIPGKCLAL